MNWLPGRRRPRLRTLLLFLLPLVAGAAVNVAVAWGLVFARDPNLVGAQERRGSRFSTGRDDGVRFLRWTVTSREVTGSVVTISEWLGPAPGNFTIGRPLDPPDPLVPQWAPELSPLNHEPIRGSEIVMTARSDGWPLRSLDGVSGCITLWSDGSTQAYLRTAMSIGSTLKGIQGANPVRIIPYGPQWPAFAINTVFYSLILWLLFAAPFAVRRRRRIKRDLCPACAYPVGSSNLCTECGKPVTPLARQPV